MTVYGMLKRDPTSNELQKAKIQKTLLQYMNKIEK